MHSYEKSQKIAKLHVLYKTYVQIELNNVPRRKSRLVDHGRGSSTARGVYQGHGYFGSCWVYDGVKWGNKKVILLGSRCFRFFELHTYSEVESFGSLGDTIFESDF